MNQEVFKKITQKKEFSQLPEKDIEIAFSHFERRQTSDEEKIRLTRDLLRKTFSGFASRKILSLKNKDEDWILKKHLSTRERFSYYKEIYKRILKNLNKEISVIDLGAGVNGFSYKYFDELNFDVNYTAIESIGQLVELMNYYFENEKIKARAIHLSLFELEKLKKIIIKTQKPRVVFLFKVVDCLEMLKKDFSKKLLLEISSLSDRIVLSFATESMIKRKKFRVNRKWLLNFIEENFEILDDFEIHGERYVVFEKR